jgi:hypothetical protein
MPSIALPAGMAAGSADVCLRSESSEGIQPGLRFRIKFTLFYGPRFLSNGRIKDESFEPRNQRK